MPDDWFTQFAVAEATTPQADGDWFAQFAEATPVTGVPTGELKPWNRSLLDKALDYIPNRERLHQGIPGVIAGAVKQGVNSVMQGGDLLRAGYNALVPESLEVERPYQQSGDIPAVTPYEQLGQRGVQAAELVSGAKGLASAGKAVPGIVARAAGMSRLRAGANIDAAARAAKDVALVTDDVAREGARALELRAAGGTLPRSVSNLMRRIGETDKPLTFEEARDFYSNISRMSANEMGRVNPTMQRQIGAIRKALDEALTQAAGTVDKGEQYKAGMQEYRRAARAQETWETVRPALMKTLRRLGYAAAAGAGYRGLSGS